MIDDLETNVDLTEYGKDINSDRSKKTKKKLRDSKIEK